MDRVADGAQHSGNSYSMAPCNRFSIMATRWAAIRAIVIMGPEAVAKARDTLSVRVALEEFPLARQELQNALFTPSA